MAAPTTFEMECEQRLQPTRIEVTAVPSEIRYDFSLNMRELTRRGASHRQRGQTVLGLTEVTLRSKLDWGGNYYTDKTTSRTCMRPSLKIAFDVTPQTVFVAKEFPRGSCAFDEIIRHELRHVEANQNQVEVVAAYLQRELSGFFGNRIFYGDARQLRNQLEQAVKTSWMPQAQARLGEVVAAHRGIDTPQEYARNLTMCNGAVRKAMGGS